MAQFLDPLLIMSLALNFVALGVSRIRGVINAVAAQGILLGILALFVHPDIGPAGHPAGRRDHHPEGVRDPEVPGPRHARGEHPARGQAGRGLHELAPPGGGRHRPGAGVLVHASPGRGAPALAAGAGLAGDGLDRLPHADDAQEGDHAGAGLPAPRERHLSLWTAAARKRCRSWSRPASCSTCSPACS